MKEKSMHDVIIYLNLLQNDRCNTYLAIIKLAQRQWKRPWDLGTASPQDKKGGASKEFGSCQIVLNMDAHRARTAQIMAARISNFGENIKK